MSHEATNWAIKQRGLKPAAKVVLWHLCDRYHPDHGCFPSQTTLADDCEMSERSIRDQLLNLEQRGLIQRVKRHGRGGSYTSNGYKFAFEDDFTSGENSPTANSADGKNASKPAANSRQNQRQNLPPNPVKEPVIEPVRLDPGFLDRFDELWKIFPRNPSSSENDAIEAFRELDLKSQAKCIDYAARYRKHIEQQAKQVQISYAERCQRVPYLSNWIERGDWLKARDLPPDPSRDPKIRQAMATQKVINRTRETKLFEACEKAQGKAAPSSVDAWAFPNQVIDQARGMIHG